MIGELVQNACVGGLIVKSTKTKSSSMNAYQKPERIRLAI